MIMLLLHILEASRPRLWLKNLGLFLPILIAGRIFQVESFVPVVLAVISFCLLSSSNYIVNDILDAAKDKKHPLKRNRPIAKQAITVQEAIIGSLILGGIGLGLAWVVGEMFFFLAFLFIIIHHLSYFWFRKLAVLDVLAIASGYVIRVMAGEQAGGITMSVWLFLAVLSGSLLMAIGKRRSELLYVEEAAKKDKGFSKEHFLYSEKILDSYVAVFASAFFLSYAFYTFLSSPIEPGFFFKGYNDFLIQVVSRKWMMITIPFVLYGIMRYVQLIYSGRGMLAKIVTSDIPLFVTFLCWLTTLLVVVYGIGG